MLAARIRADLPAFPDEVIQTWLVPIAEDAGWPPMALSRWGRVLNHHSLAFLRGLRWGKQRLHLEYMLESESFRRIQELLDANVDGVDNEMARQIPSTGERFWSAVRYLEHYGQLPAPPVLLQMAVQYEVLDGHHRLAAYFRVGASLLGLTCWVARPG